MTLLLAVLLSSAAVPGFSLHTDPSRIEVGDTGSITIPFGNMEGGVSPIENVRLVVRSAPAWVAIDTVTSYLGPTSIYPGEQIVFDAAYSINASYNPASPTGDIILDLLSDSTSFVPSGITWTFVTSNGFKTMSGACVANDGIPCGTFVSSDTLAPNTYLAFAGSSYEPGSGAIFIATSTLVSFVGSDAYESNAAISGASLTGYASDSPPAAFNALNFSTTPFTLVQGPHTLYFASRDYAGNTEIIKSSTVIVDGEAPLTEYQIIGSSFTDGQGNLVISTDAYVSLSGTDTVSGLSRIMYRLDNGEFAVYAGTFSLAEGTHRIEFYGVDNVENLESAHILNLFSGAVPQTVVWSGLAGDGDWYNPGNWRDGAVPGTNDTAILATRDTVRVTSGATFYSLVLGDAAGETTPIMQVSAPIRVSSSVVVNPGATLLQDTLGRLEFGSMRVKSGGRIEHTANSDVIGSIVNLKVSGEFVLEAGASITLKGLGYAGGVDQNNGRGYGPGGGRPAYNGWAGGGGAGHGGQGVKGSGYAGYSGAGGAGYGELINPVEAGSGGGTGSWSAPGGAGGGVFILEAGVAVLDGAIDVSGAESGIGVDGGTANGGGGSGGSVNIEAGSIHGSGLVIAKGGSGGGGGRVALKAYGSEESGLVVNAGGGVGASVAGAGTIYRSSGNSRRLIVSRDYVQNNGSDGLTIISSYTVGGTSIALSGIVFHNASMQFEGVERISISESAEFSGVNWIDNAGEGNFPGGGLVLGAMNDVGIATMTLPGDSTLTLSGATLRVSSLTALGDIILDSAEGIGSMLEQTGLSEWTVGNILVKSGSKITHRANDAQKLHAVNIKVLGNMTVELGGSVDVSGKGYAGGAAGAAGSGPGGGGGTLMNGGDGGGYGGVGGIGHGGTAGGMSYGDIAAPAELGSGGGGSNGAAGGAGGGQITLNVLGHLIMDGVLAADGFSGGVSGEYGAGGGSGGAIKISAGNLSGSGTITVAGGAGGAGIRVGGGGAGGRVSGAQTFTGTRIGFGGLGAQAGQNGTWYDSDAAVPGVSAEPFSDVGAFGFSVNWMGESDAWYMVELSRREDFASLDGSSVTFGTSMVFGGLSGNTTYYARVAGINGGLVATNYVGLGSTVTLRNPGETWIGPSGGDWHNPDNWDNGAVPVITDTVTINGNFTVMTYSTNPAVAFSSLIIGKSDGAVSPTLVLATGAVGDGAVVVYPGAVLKQDTLGRLEFGSMRVKSGGRIEHTANGGVKRSIVNLKVSGEFILEAGSSVTLKGLGYAGGVVQNNGYGYGPGRGSPSYKGWAGGGGAGHGGMGAKGTGYYGYSGAGGVGYGELLNPAELGSGGGMGSWEAPGGSGGGVFILEAGVAVLDGAIDVSGAESGIGVDGGTANGGGGSGGSVNIEAESIHGSGLIIAKGGSSGGGGRVALKAYGSEESGLVVNAGGGVGASVAGAGTIYRSSGSGARLIVSREYVQNNGLDGVTVISSQTIGGATITLGGVVFHNASVQFEGVERISISESAEFSGVNWIDNAGEGNFPGGGLVLGAMNDVGIATMTLPGDSTLTLSGATLRVSSLTALGDIILDSAEGIGSMLEQTGLSEWTVGNILVKSGSKITHRANDAQKLHAVNIKVLGDMTVEQGARVDVSGKGYAGGASGAAGSGPGGGAGTLSNGGGGAGYGGVGGRGHGGTPGGVSYGDIAVPAELGSGGGGSNGAAGGAGGGQITLNVLGHLIMDGVLAADGFSGGVSGEYGAGGGSGGTINISAGNLTGGGTITVAGGMGGAGSISSGGGGAGGRVSGAHAFAGTRNGFGGIGLVSGQNGTWYDSGAAIPTAAVAAFSAVGPLGFAVNWFGESAAWYIAELSRREDFASLDGSSIIFGTSMVFGGLSGNTTYYARVAGISGGLVATTYVDLGSTVTLRNPGETWIGPSGGDWHNPDNWDNSAVPVITDTVTINGNFTVMTYSTNPAVAFSSLIIGKSDGAVSPTLVLATGAVGDGAVVVYPGAVLKQDTLGRLEFGSMRVKSGGRLEHTANSDVIGSVVNLKVSGEFVLEAGASVTLKGLGYAGGVDQNNGRGYGPGGGRPAYNGWAGGGGAGHGGQGVKGSGYAGYSGAGGAGYGELINPVEAGSGGGTGSWSAPGGAGGGVFVLDAGVAVLDGSIDVSGAESGIGLDGATANGGGGSGGSVNINAGSLYGSGRVIAKGGSSGGGGRVALKASGSDESELVVSADGGVGGQIGGAGTIYRSSGNSRRLIVSRDYVQNNGSDGLTIISSYTVGGTSIALSGIVFHNASMQFEGVERISISESAEFSGVNWIDNAGEGNFPGGGLVLGAMNDVGIATMTLPAESTLTLAGATLRVSSLTALGDIILESGDGIGSVMEQTGLGEWTVGNIVVKSGSVITHRANGSQKSYAVNMKVLGDMTVEQGARVDVSGKGYSGGASGAAGSGPGGGAGTLFNGGGGAGYGGVGGRGHGGTPGGVSYGDIAVPAELGSGGGGSNGAAGGAGGGEIKLEVYGALTVNGLLLADGVAGGSNGSYGAGGGSGGTINIAAGNLSGSGAISVAGGAGGAGSARGGGGGAGGRVGLFGDFAGAVTVRGGAGGDFGAAGAYGTSGAYHAVSSITVNGQPEVFANASKYVSVEKVDVSTGTGSAVLGAADATGVYPVSAVYEVGPENTTFDPPLLLTFRYSTSTLAAYNISEENVYLYHYEADGTLVRVPGQIRDFDRKEILVQLSQLNSIFAIFGESADTAPPVTTLAVAGVGYQAESGDLYLGEHSSVTLSAYDPVVYGTSTGVAYTEYRIDADTDAVPFVMYTAAFGLTAGRHVVEFHARDKAGNVEALKSIVVNRDAAAPETSVAISGGAGGNGWRKSSVAVSFTSTDSASGVGGIFYRLMPGSTGYMVYSAPAEISSEGLHAVYYFAEDNVGNREAERRADFGIDLSSPVATATSIPPANPAGWNNSPVTVVFVGTDAVSGVASCTSEVTLELDGVDMRVPGQCSDAAGNVGYATATVNIDMSVPAITLNSPLAGRTFVATREMVGIDFAVADNLDPASAFSGFLVQTEDRGSKRGDRPSKIAVTSGQSIEPLDIDDGVWKLLVSATDFADNTSTLDSESFEVIHDVLPPASSLSISGAYHDGDGVVYLKSDTALALSSLDHLVQAGDGIGLGVKKQVVAVGLEGSAAREVVFESAQPKQGEPFVSTFTFASLGILPDGRHNFSFKAEDILGNIEVSSHSVFGLDNAAPEGSVQLAGTAGENGWYVSPVSISLSATDALSGVAGIFYRVDGEDGDAFTGHAGAIQVSDEGQHMVRFYAKDNLGNTSAQTSSSFKIDRTAPESALSVTGDTWENAGKKYLSLRSLIALSASDPVSGGTASGVEGIEYHIDAGSFSVYAAPFSLTEGARVVGFRARDKAGNIENIKTAWLWVDSTAPMTEISIAGTRHDAEGVIYITRDSGVVLAGVDPVSNETASGVLLTKYRVDGGNWQIYAGSFTIIAEGAHTLEFRSIDRVQNTEQVRSAALVVDNAPPATAVTLGEPKSSAFGLPILTPDAPITLTAADVASSLKQIYYEPLDIAAGSLGVRSYTEPFALPQGTYDLRFWSVDNLGNIEPYRQVRFAVSSYLADSLQAADGLDMSGTADIAGAVRANKLVSVGGNARILGDVTASTITVTGKAQITGQKTEGAAPIPSEPIFLGAIPEIQISTVPAGYIVGGRLVLSSKAMLTLTTGTYHFNGIELSGGAEVRIAGKVDIMVSGDVLISGGSSLNAAGKASNLTIFVNAVSSISCTGGGNFVARVYAPRSHMKLAGNSLLGGHYFVKTAAVSGTGNILQAGEMLPKAAATAGDPGGGRKKVSAADGAAENFNVLAGPDPAFMLGEIYVFPNPAMRGAAPTLHIEAGIADRVKIKFFTVSGRHAHETTLTGMPAALDDGNGVSYAYEYTWRDSIPSGVYYYSIEAEKAGQKLRKAGKFAVVR